MKGQRRNCRRLVWTAVLGLNRPGRRTEQQRGTHTSSGRHALPFALLRAAPSLVAVSLRSIDQRRLLGSAVNLRTESARSTRQEARRTLQAGQRVTTPHIERQKQNPSRQCNVREHVLQVQVPELHRRRWVRLVQWTQRCCGRRLHAGDGCGPTLLSGLGDRVGPVPKRWGGCECQDALETA